MWIEDAVADPWCGPLVHHDVVEAPVSHMAEDLSCPSGSCRPRRVFVATLSMASSIVGRGLGRRRRYSAALSMASSVVGRRLRRRRRYSCVPVVCVAPRRRSASRIGVCHGWYRVVFVVSAPPMAKCGGGVGRRGLVVVCAKFQFVGWGQESTRRSIGALVAQCMHTVGALMSKRARAFLQRESCSKPAKHEEVVEGR